MWGIVDCNSFYCSCERVFKPQLADKPVVVLSNNDGCIIALSDEAKDIGIRMAIPYFEAKGLIETHNVSVFSSNYNLYGDMSRRVMDVLKEALGHQNVEVYSIDEAFLKLHGHTENQLMYLGKALRAQVEQCTGVKVSVGIAPTKTLSKLANRLAKKQKAQTGCVCLLDTDEKIQRALKETPVRGLWGVGRQFACKLESMSIATAWQLRQMPEEWMRKNMGGVVGARLHKELCCQEALFMEEPLENKKMIATTRMFGTPASTLQDVKEAIATYTSRAAEKLRRQCSAAGVISVFVVPKEKPGTPHFTHGPSLSAHSVLPCATADTTQLIKAAMALTEKLFEEGRKYKKTGVILSGLVPDTSIQGNLFKTYLNRTRCLMQHVDNINFSMRNDIVKFAASGTTRNWKMQCKHSSERYTTRWEELFNVG